MSDRIEIKVPDIGDFSDIPVIELLVAEGDRVDAEDGLITLESDKATMEVPAPAAGVGRDHGVDRRVAVDRDGCRAGCIGGQRVGRRNAEPARVAGDRRCARIAEARQRVQAGCHRLRRVGAAVGVRVVIRIPGDADLQAAGATGTGRKGGVIEDVVERAVVRVGDRELDFRILADSHVQHVLDVVLEVLADQLHWQLVSDFDAQVAAAHLRIRAVALRTDRIVVDAARVPARSKVDVVVAGAAGLDVLHQAPVAGLRRVRVGFFMAGRAVAHVLWEHDVRVVDHSAAVTHDEVAVRQVLAIVNLVDHRLHVDRAAPGLVDGVAVDRVRVVAGHAVVDVGTRAAMEVDDVVAGKAGVIVDDAALEQRVAADRHEVVDAVRRDRRLFADLDAEAVSLGLVEHRPCRIVGQRLGERVLVGAVAVVDPGAHRAAFGGCLGVGDAATVARDVGLPFAGVATRAG